ncbi:MAG TPA: YkgJ family cysteine cluster protein [Candidatus Methanomethylophilaceae archaeon]|nr:YkgJ family cysteine cluster protein [Candidatus Methanomethylophilaceae archaeon]
MAVYRGRYILQGLGEISPEMEKDLDLAYDICEYMHNEFPCEECGKCCYQDLITILPEEVDRVSSAAKIPLGKFMSSYAGIASDGRIMLLQTNPCAFLGKDNGCTIWKDRPQICDDFPYMVSMFMSRVYLAIVNEEADILELIDYMDDSWPCTVRIKGSVSKKVDEAREIRRSQRP